MNILEKSIAERVAEQIETDTKAFQEYIAEQVAEFTSNSEDYMQKLGGDGVKIKNT